MANRRRRTSVYGAAALTFGAGLAVTAILFVAVSALEYGKLELGFQQRANVRVAAIRRGLDDAVEVLSMAIPSAPPVGWLPDKSILPQ